MPVFLRFCYMRLPFQFLSSVSRLSPWHRQIRVSFPPPPPQRFLEYYLLEHLSMSHCFALLDRVGISAHFSPAVPLPPIEIMSTPFRVVYILVCTPHFQVGHLPTHPASQQHTADAPVYTFHAAFTANAPFCSLLSP